jgi:hypothetical protein
LIMNRRIAILIFGEPGSARNALTEEKYAPLATFLTGKGFRVDSKLYHDSRREFLENELAEYAVILVWVNPVEKGFTRSKLDELLRKLSSRGCYVSAHPDTILQIGTKEVLYKTRDTAFGSDTRLYHSFSDFKNNFLQAAERTGIRILKPYRGNGGQGVCKVDTSRMKDQMILLTPADHDSQEEGLNLEDFFTRFESYFSGNSMLLDQEWNPGIINGMVRCYLSEDKVAGFGYQEINALYPSRKPGKRFYFSEDCGLFQDLRSVMNKSWISQLLQLTGTSREMLPIIWDADFFINKVNSHDLAEKYTLCEINASSVSPFPESAIPFMVAAIEKHV